MIDENQTIDDSEIETVEGIEVEEPEVLPQGVTAIEGLKAAYTNADGPYACYSAQSAMSGIRNAASFLVYGPSTEPRRILEDSHPLVMAANSLAEFDKTICEFVQKKHNPDMFKIVRGFSKSRDTELLKKNF